MSKKYIYEQTQNWVLFRVIQFITGWTLIGLLYFGEIQTWVFIVVFWLLAEVIDVVKVLHREVEY